MQAQPDNLRTRIKKDIVSRVVRAFFAQDPTEEMRLIPFEMKPLNSGEDPFRCCVYHDREIIASRTTATLGFSIEDRDERDLLSTLFERAVVREKPENIVLTVLKSACRRCVPSKIQVTELCQGCLVQSCLNVCRFDAIEMVNGKSVIDPKKCKNCEQCMGSCPYTAIVRYHVPCEEVCPVGAMVKDSSGYAKIDFDKCISCGKCVHACPFGAVHEKSQVIDILRRIKEGEKCIILLAPSIMWQVHASIKQLRTAFLEAGFYDVYEVAQGADITTKNEGDEFVERIEHHKAPFMTTSCCAAYNQLLDKHLEEMRTYVSETRTPLSYIAEIAHKREPDAAIVFASPCVAKRKEGQLDPSVDFVISFEECLAVFDALDIVPEECEESEYTYLPTQEGRNYAVTSGVATAVRSYLEGNQTIKPYCINGISKKSIKELRKMATSGTCEQGNLIEVMSCEGGCVGGNSCLSRMARQKPKVIN